MKKELNEILTALHELLPRIREEYMVESIAVFGSYVRNEQDIDSDLDVLVTFSIVPTILRFIALKNYLSDNLEINVDLVMKDSLKPIIGRNILMESIPI